MKRKRGVLSIWATLLLVLVGFVCVIGVVTLIMFLSGQLNKKIIEPQNLSISLADGSEGFVSGNNNFYVANDFKLVVNTTTADVTEKTIRLKFTDGSTTKNGYITDNDRILTVPEYVTIGKPFEVTLGRDYNSELDADIVIGGFKSLTAESVENVELPHLSFTVAVDVPVSNIEVGVDQGASTVFNNFQTVTIGSVFDFRVDFKPEQSQFVFSDNTQKKEYFYDFSTSGIRRNWNTGHFEAYSKNGSVDEVTVYTFANSYYRQLALKEIEESYENQNLKDENPLEYNTAMLSYFGRNPAGAVTYTFQIQVVDVTVNKDSLKLKNGGSYDSVPLDPVYVDKYYTLTANSENGDDTLGITVYDTSDTEKPYLVANVGIKMPEDIDINDLVIEGDKVMQVDKETGDITELQFVLEDAKGGKYNSTDQYSYYILPNTTPKNSGDYFWRFNATKDLSTQTFAINFFYENEMGKIVSLYEFGADKEKSAILTIKEQTYEEPPYWKETSESSVITMNITYDSEGTAKTAVVDLNEYLNPLNEANIYDVVRYFLMFPTISGAEDVVKNVFPYKSVHTYTKDYKDQPLSLKIQGYDKDSYELYELETSLLYALRSYSSTALVLAATIRTDADHNPYLDGEGTYKIVNLSTPKAVIVESALSIVNMTPSFSFVKERGITPYKDGKYYVPAINRSASGSSLDMIEFNLTVNSDGDPTTNDKVIQAFQNKNLTIECLDTLNNVYDIDYLQLESLNVEGTKFKGRIAINETAFTQEHLDNYSNLDVGKPIKLRLVYNNGVEKQYKDMYLEDDPSVTTMNIYYPQPYYDVQGGDGKYYIEGRYQEFFGSATTTTQHTLKVDISDTTTINWVDKEGRETDISSWGDALGLSGGANAIEILNKLLTFTLKDQYDNDIAEGLYSIRLVEEDENGNPVTAGAIGRSQLLNEIVNLSPTANGKPTYLRAYIVENAITENTDDYFVKVYDEQNVPTGDRLGSVRFEFNITGKGINHIDYDSDRDLTATTWTDSLNNGTVIVEKVINPTKNTTPSVELNKLVHVYKTGEGHGKEDDHQNQNGYADVIFLLDPEWFAMLSSKDELSKMLQFNDTLSLTDDGIETTPITSIKFLNVFSSDTELKFVITDSSRLFRISFVFKCISDVEIKPDFSRFTKQYESYLVSSPNNSQEIALFGNYEYKLDDFTTFSNTLHLENYSWEDAFDGKDPEEKDPEGAYTLVDSSSPSVAKIIKKGSDIYLHLEEVYVCTSVTVAVYYHIKSTYSPILYLNIYINPNIIMREDLTQSADGVILDLASDLPAFETNYKFYRALGQNGDGYLNGNSFEGKTEIPIEKLTFNFAEDPSTQYIQISEKTDESGTYQYKLNTGTLDLKFGQLVAQKFNVVTGNSDFNAIRIVTIGDNTTIYKSDNALQIQLYISYAADVSQIFKQEENKKIETVLYGENKETYVILVPNGNGGPSSYQPANNTVFTSVSGGALTRQDEQHITVSGTSFKNFIKYDNSIVATRTLSDGEGTLEIRLTVNVIVSVLGDKLLNYNNQYNHFTAKDEKDNTEEIAFSDLMANGNVLTAKNVYQELSAGGSYKIVHDTSTSSSTTTIDEKENESGFYFYYNQRYTVILDIVQDQYNIAQRSRSEGNTRYYDTITLGNLENTFGDVYVILRLTITSSGNNLISYYYRVKVTPNFKMGGVIYPFEVEGEYLDTSSKYYNALTKHYEINLDEKFDETNSYLKDQSADKDKTGKTRFVDPKIEGKTLTYSYKIGNIYDEDISSTSPLVGKDSDYLTSAYETDGVLDFFKDFETQDPKTKYTKLNIGLVDETRRLTVEIIKSFESDNVSLVGGDLVYKLRFNQGRQYAYRIEGDNVSPNQKNSNTYTTTLTVNDTESDKVFSIYLAEKGGLTETEINNYDWYITNTGNDTILSDNFKFTSKGEGQIGKVLTITTPASIKKDFTVEIGFYTTQKRVFRFVVNFTSNLKETPNETFVGGETYKFAKEGDKKGSIFSKDGYTIEAKEKDPNGAFYAITSESIEFAHLTEDKDFTFTATKGNYSFDFTITVKASINLNTLQNRIITDPTHRFGQVKFDVNLSDIITAQGLTASVNSKFTFGAWGEQLVESQSITPDDVAKGGEIVRKSFTLTYRFNNNESTEISYTFNYQYTVDENVKITQNYPKPDGENPSEREYLSSETAKQSDAFFFTNVADFATGARIQVDDLTTEVAKEKPIAQKWTINITSLNNLRVTFDGSVIGAGSNIITNTTIDDLNNKVLIFELVNPAINGTAEFAIEINKVPTTYSVTVVSGEAISIQRNRPQSDKVGTEIIYAENMQNKGSDIFAQDRILKYKFNQNAVGTHYVKLQNEAGDTKIIGITVDELKQFVNLDLGKSYTGYKVNGTYSTPEATGTAESDSQLFEAAPTLTSRIVAIYADDTAIKNEKVTIEIKRQEEQVYVAIGDFKLKSTDFDKSVTVDIQLKFDGNEITVPFTYDYILTVDFEVGNNADNIEPDGAGASYVTVNAGEEKSLLDELGFLVRHSSGDKALYTSADMQNSVGRLNLKLYDDELEIEKSDTDTLTNSAFNYDTYLKAAINEGGIIYKTGLNPFSPKGLSYITRKGTSVDTEGKEYDYTLSAEGAGNDGNFVMMRLSYIVTFDDVTVTASHNILLKILPNSSISFKENSTSNATEGDNTMVIAGQSIWTNKNIKQYEVENTTDGDSIVLWDKENQANSAIQVNMYKNFSAKDFDYTYNLKADSGYNDWDVMNQSFDAGNGQWSAVQDENKTTIKATATPNSENNFVINVPYLTFGTTRFYIEFENNYGFKARFYFQKSSALNPTVSKVGENDVLHEGDKFVFGVDFMQIASDAPVYTFVYNEDGKAEDTGEITIKGFDKQKENGQVEVTATFEFGMIYAKDKPTADKFSNVPRTLTATIKRESDNITSIKIETLTWKLGLDPIDLSSGDTKLYYYKNGNVSQASDVASFFRNNKPTISVDLSGLVPDNSAEENPTLQDISVFIQYGTKVETKDQLTRRYRSESGDGVGVAEGAESTVVVHMSGIDAYGFDKKDGIVDKYSATGGDGQQDFTSNINKVLIDHVDFYKTDGTTWLGSSILGRSNKNGIKEIKVGGTDGESEPYNTSALSGDLGKIYTSEGYEFIFEEASKFEPGITVGTKENNEFVVPYINGIEFGENESIDAIMRVTIRGGDQDTNKQTRTTDFQVQINRDDYVTSAEAQINDGASVTTDEAYKFATKTEEVNGENTATWLNDTLEIDLAPYTTINFAVHNRGDFKTENNTLQVNLNTTTEKTKDNYVAASIKEVENKNPFWITAYVSISGSMVAGAFTKNLDNDPNNDRNLEDADRFYIYLLSQTVDEGYETKDAVFRYNGQDITMNAEQPQAEETSFVPKTSAGTPIAEYKPESITLRINDTRELSSGHKQVELYFLKKMGSKTMYADGNRVYRYSKSFSVHPEYSVAIPQINGGDGETLQISDYYKVTHKNNEQDPGTSYYVIPMSVWGKNVMLKVNESDKNEEGASISEKEAYKYEFEIEQAQGSASIDKYGNIITNSDFGLSWNQMSVTICTKVAGFDCKFEDGNGTVDLTQIGVPGKEIKLSFKKAESEPTEGIEETPGCYYIEGLNRTLITLGEGDTLYAIGDVSKTASLVGEVDSKTTIPDFALTPNQQLDLQQMFKDVFRDKGWTNVNFYLVGYSKDEGDINTIVRNNIDVYQAGFAEAGTYKITVVATGKTNNQTEKQTEQFTSTIYVYDTSEPISIAYAQNVDNGGTANLSIITGTGEGETWYELKDGKTTKYEDGKVTVKKGVEDRQFLLGNRLYKITFVGYGNTNGEDAIKKEVATSVNYSLSNLVDNKGGKFYKIVNVNGKNQLSRDYNIEYISANYGTSRVEKYFYSINGTITKYEVTYHIVSSSITNYNGTLPVTAAHEVSKYDVYSLVKEMLNIQMKISEEANTEEAILEEMLKYMTIYEKGTNGVLTEFNGKTFSSDEWGDGLASYRFSDLVVIWGKSGSSEKSQQITLDCFLFENEKTVVIDDVDRNITYNLANASEPILKALEITDAGSITFYEIKDGVVDIRAAVSEIFLGNYLASGKYEGTFLINVGNKYYKINLTLNIKKAQVTG